MKKIIKYIESHFGILLSLTVLISLIFPGLGIFIKPYFDYLMMFILLLVFLKIDTADGMNQIKNIPLISYLSAMKMLVMPVFCYLIALPFGNDIALSVLLLTSMPVATAAGSLSGLYKGNVSLAVALTIITSLLAPATVPVLFKFLAGKSIHVSYLQMTTGMIKMIVIPFCLALIINRFYPKMVAATKWTYSSITVILLIIFIYGAVSLDAKHITSEPLNLIKPALVIYAVFIILHVIGYFLIPKGSREDKITAIIATAYPNNGLAIALVAKILPPETLVIVILSELPWNTLLMPLGWVLKKYKNKI